MREGPAERQRRAPRVALDPLGRPAALGEGDRQPDRGADQALVPAQRARAFRHPAVEREAANGAPPVGHRRRRWRVLDRRRPHLAAIHEQHDAVDHQWRPLAQPGVAVPRIDCRGGPRPAGGIPRAGAPATTGRALGPPKPAPSAEGCAVVRSRSCAWGPPVAPTVPSTATSRVPHAGGRLQPMPGILRCQGSAQDAPHGRVRPPPPSPLSARPPVADRRPRR